MTFPIFFLNYIEVIHWSSPYIPHNIYETSIYRNFTRNNRKYIRKLIENPGFENMGFVNEYINSENGKLWL